MFGRRRRVRCRRVAAVGVGAAGVHHHNKAGAVDDQEPDQP